MRTLSLSVLLLASCGRAVTDADVRPVGVGSDPDEIGPAPKALGGVVGYDHVEMAGGALALAHMGLGSFDEVGPGMIGFAPPYSAVIGFSYLFDQKLSAAATLTFTAPAPPATPDTCYTVFEPEGPIGSFNTVDVGDAMKFTAVDGSAEFTMGRVPYDLPPNTKNLFVYYSSVEPTFSLDHQHLVPNPDDPTNPAAMVEETWKKPNFPFGTEMVYSFQGGFSRFDEPIASIPLPSASVDGGSPHITLPGQVGSVMMSWNGPQYDETGADLGDGDHAACLQFYGEGQAVSGLADCDVPYPTPTDAGSYDSFPGQIYTGPWETSSGVRFQWNAGSADDEVALAVRFMAPVEPDDPDFQTPQMSSGSDYRPATQCEQKNAEMRFDQSLLDDSGQLLPTLQGDPQSRMVEVSCRLADDGDFTLDNAMLSEAMRYIGNHPAGGAVFFFSRGTRIEGTVPPAKDQYDQLHEITPIGISARDVKIGRFQWNGAPDGGAQ